jgi:adenylate kinase family enzyme
MILFLFGTWGAGKSFVGDLIEEYCDLPHLEADLHFTFDLVDALRQKLFHVAELEPFYRRVIVEMDSYKKRFGDFVVSQGIYKSQYRRMIYEVFQNEIMFVWVRTPDRSKQEERLGQRSGGGNPITIEVFKDMEKYWEPPIIPHEVLENDDNLINTLPILLQKAGLCYHMNSQEWEKAIINTLMGKDYEL